MYDIRLSLGVFGAELNVAHPTLIANALGAFSTDANSNYIGGGVEQRFAHLLEIGVAHRFSEVVDGHS